MDITTEASGSAQPESVGWFRFSEGVSLMYAYAFDGNTHAIDCLMSKLTPSFATMIVDHMCLRIAQVERGTIHDEWQRGLTHMLCHDKFEPSMQFVKMTLDRLLSGCNHELILILLSSTRLTITPRLFYEHIQRLSDLLEGGEQEMAPAAHVDVIQAIVDHATFRCILSSILAHGQLVRAVPLWYAAYPCVPRTKTQYKITLSDDTLFAGVGEWGRETEHEHPMPVAHRRYDALVRVRQHLPRVDRLLDDERLPVNVVAAQYSWIFRNPKIARTLLRHEMLDVHKMVKM